MPLRVHSRGVVIGAMLLSGTKASAADNFQVLADGLTATANKSISALAYKPDLDGAGPDEEALFTAAFGFTMTGSNAAIRKLTDFNVGDANPTVSTPMVSEAQMRFFYTEGDTNASINGTAPFAIMINPKPIGSIPAYGDAWLVDQVTVASTPSRSDRVSRYSLQTVTSNADALVQITNLNNLDDYTAISGGTSTNQGRRGAWSGDGQYIYQSDSTTAQSGGIWRTSALTGATQRLVSGNDFSTTTELEVIPGPNGADRILYYGKAGTPATFNAGGINYIDYDGVTAGSPQIFLAAADLADFLDAAVVTRTGAVEPHSIVTGLNGDLYFMEDGADIVVKRDAQGRLMKIHTRDERIAAGLTTGSSNLDLFTRQMITPGGFTATQIMFTENSSNAVIGAIDYKAGDFDRNNAVNQTDRNLFLAALTPRIQYDNNAMTPTIPDLPVVSKFDLNGNHTVDWKDVKILQTFLGFANGDANLDLALNLTDLNLMRDNHVSLGGSANKTWAHGDIASLSPTATTYAPSNADANTVDLVDLQATATAWLFTLNQPNLTTDDMDANGYTGQFRTDVITAFNPGINLYWDVNGTAPGAGGGTTPSGDWDGSTTNLNTDSTGGSGGSLTAASGGSDTVNFAADTGSSGSYTVNVSGTRTASHVVIDEGNVNFTGGTLAVAVFTVASGATAEVDSVLSGGAHNSSLSKNGPGTLTLDGATTFTGTTRVNAGTLAITQGLKSGGALIVEDTAKAVIPASSPDTFNPPITVPSGSNTTGSIVSSISLNGSAQLDLNNNDMVVDHNGSSPLTDIRDLIASGYNFGAHDGPGLVSTTAALTDPFTFALGYAENADLPLPYGTVLSGGTFAGIDPDATAVLIKFTWVGDVTLDGVFDFQDLSIFNGNYDSGATTGRVWTDGDLNYDGTIDFQDLSLFNGNYDPSKPSLPEPSSLGALGLLSLALFRRRRR